MMCCYTHTPPPPFTAKTPARLKHALLAYFVLFYLINLSVLRLFLYMYVTYVTTLCIGI